jgi:phosphoserine phosphatase RsbX
MDIGSASRAMPGEAVCGDRHLVVRREHQALIVVADGLGHGPQAGAAAEAACEVARAQPALGLTDLIRVCDQRLRGTRGAAVALLRIDAREHRLDHLAVGNVEVVARSAEVIRPICVPGVVGGHIRKLFEQSFTLTPGDCVVCFTDGISTRFEVDRYRGRDAQVIASAILNEWGKGHDDATCVVVTY